MLLLRQAELKTERVMVHCRHGVSRSVAVILAYMVTLGWGLEEALDHLRARRKSVGPNLGFMNQLGLWRRMGGRLDFGERWMVDFLLQRGKVRRMEEPSGYDDIPVKSYKCRKCRRLLALSNYSIPHQPGLFPSWICPSSSSPSCSSGLLLTPPHWLSSDLLLAPCSRLLCPCGAKLGGVGEEVTCPCGAQGGRGVLLLLTKVDMANAGKLDIDKFRTL